MTAEYMRKLEKVEFEREPHDLKWNKRLQQLREFKVQFGHCLVPNQRYHSKIYHEGKPSLMTAERVRDLESVDFNFLKIY